MNYQNWEEQLLTAKTSLFKEFQFLLYFAFSLIMSGIGIIFYKYGVYHLHYWAFTALCLVEIFFITQLLLTNKSSQNFEVANSIKKIYFSHLPEVVALLLMSLQGYALYLFEPIYDFSEVFHVINIVLFIAGAYQFLSRTLLLAGLGNVLLYLSFSKESGWENYLEMYVAPNLYAIVIFNLFCFMLMVISYIFKRFTLFNFYFFFILMMCNYLYLFDQYIAQNEVFAPVFIVLIALQMLFSKIDHSPFLLYSALALFFLFLIYEIGLVLNKIGLVKLLIINTLITLAFFLLLKFAKRMFWNEPNEMDR
jgi:hypothetical protein